MDEKLSFSIQIPEWKIWMTRVFGVPKHKNEFCCYPMCSKTQELRIELSLDVHIFLFWCFSQVCLLQVCLTWTLFDVCFGTIGGLKMMMVFICFGTLFDVFSQDMVYWIFTTNFQESYGSSFIGSNIKIISNIGY